MSGYDIQHLIHTTKDIPALSRYDVDTQFPEWLKDYKKWLKIERAKEPDKYLKLCVDSGGFVWSYDGKELLSDCKPSDCKPITLSVSSQTDWRANAKGKVATEGFKQVTVKWERLFEMTSSAHYSGSVFRDGHRAKKNVTGFTDALIFDVDSDATKGRVGYTLDELRDALGGLRYFIATTTSHTPENDRYRLLLPLDAPISFEIDYRLFHEVSLEFLGLDKERVDTACIEISRQFAPNRSGLQWHWYGHGDVVPVAAIAGLIDSIKQEVVIPTPAKSYTHSGTSPFDTLRQIWTPEKMRDFAETHLGARVDGKGFLHFAGNATKAVKINERTGRLHDFSQNRELDAVDVLVERHGMQKREAAEYILGRYA